jgi:LPS-assembly lipoprotein
MKDKGKSTKAVVERVFFILPPSALIFAFLLAACGFHLRGDTALPFSTLYVSGPPNSSIVNDLKRRVTESGMVQLTEKPEAAEVALQILGDTREKVILSLSSAGKVREFQLRHRVSFKLGSADTLAGAQASEILLNRTVSFNDAQILAKESEEAILYRDMERDVVQQLLYRLAAVKS